MNRREELRSRAVILKTKEAVGVMCMSSACAGTQAIIVLTVTPSFSLSFCPSIPLSFLHSLTLSPSLYCSPSHTLNLLSLLSLVSNLLHFLPSVPQFKLVSFSFKPSDVFNLSFIPVSLRFSCFYHYPLIIVLFLLLPPIFVIPPSLVHSTSLYPLLLSLYS